MGKKQLISIYAWDENQQYTVGQEPTNAVKLSNSPVQYDNFSEDPAMFGK